MGRFDRFYWGFIVDGDYTDTFALDKIDNILSNIVGPVKSRSRGNNQTEFVYDRPLKHLYPRIGVARDSVQMGRVSLIVQSSFLCQGLWR